MNDARRPIKFRILLILSAAITLFLLIPEDKPRITSSPTPFFYDEELIDLAQSHRWQASDKFFDINQIKANLGRALFFDARLSKSQTVSCATCHQPNRSFTDGRKTALGDNKTPGTRNTPTLVNIVNSPWLFWDGRADSLAMQAMGPLESPKEHGSNRAHIAKIVATHYRPVYEAIYGEIPKEITDWLSRQSTESLLTLNFNDCPQGGCVKVSDQMASYVVATLSSSKVQTDIVHSAANTKSSPQDYLNTLIKDKLQPTATSTKHLSKPLQNALTRFFFNIGDSLAHYQRGIISRNSPFDSFLKRLNRSSKQLKAAFDSEFSEDHWEGFRIFTQMKCHNCHSGPDFSDYQFHNIGLPTNEKLVKDMNRAFDLGRAIGIQKRQVSPFRCDLQEDYRSNSESCREAKFLRVNDFETVGAFKTPTLRNLQDTAPYMHDGRFSDLGSVIRHYESHDDPAVGHRDESIQTFPLTYIQRRRLIMFLESLSGSVDDLDSTNRL